MEKQEKIIGKYSGIGEKIFLYLALLPLFLFSRKDIYWQSAASFGAIFFVLVGLASYLVKNKNKISFSLVASFSLAGVSFFYLLARKYNVFAYVTYIKLDVALLVYVYVSLLIKKYGKAFFDASLKFLIHALFFVASYSLFFYFLYSKDPSIFADLASPIIQRGIVMGPFGYSNTFAIFMVLGVFLTQYFSIEKMEKEKPKRQSGRIESFLTNHFYDFLSALFISILFITTSRFAMVIFLVLLLGYLLFLGVLKRNYKKTVLGKMIVIFSLSAFLVGIFNQNNLAVLKFSQQKLQVLFETIVDGKTDYSGATRIYLLKFSLQQFLKNKLFGNNLGSFGFLLRQYTQAGDFEKLIDPHSFFARILAETGVIGVLTIFLPIFYLFLEKLVFAFKARNTTNNANDFIVAFGAAALFLHMNIDMDFVFPITLVVLLMVLALLPGKEFYLNLRSGKTCLSLAIILLLFASAILPNFVAVTLLLRKDMSFPYYKPQTLAIAKFLYPKNSYLDETIAENISNHISGETKDNEALNKALISYDKYSQAIEGDYLPYLNKGLLLFRLGNPRAIAQFKKAIILAPMTPETNGWYALAQTVFYNDISKENLEYGQKSMDILGGVYSGNLFFANYYRLTGQTAKMLQELDFLKANYPSEGGTYFIAYLYYQKRGEVENMTWAKAQAKARGWVVENFEQNLS